MKTTPVTQQPPRHLQAIEAALREIARHIADSAAPELVRLDALVRLSALIAAEKTVVFRARIAAPAWEAQFAA